MSGFGPGLDPRVLMAMSGGNNSDTPEWWKGIDEEERKRREEEEKRKLARPSGMGSMDDIRQIEDPNGQIRFEGPGINIRVRNQTALDRIRQEAGKMVGLPAQSRGSYNETPGPVAPPLSTEQLVINQGISDALDTRNRVAYNPGNATNLIAQRNAMNQGALSERQWNEGAPGRDAYANYQRSRGQADINESEAKLQREKTMALLADKGLTRPGQGIGGDKWTSAGLATQKKIIELEAKAVAAERDASLFSDPEEQRKSLEDAAMFRSQIEELRSLSGQGGEQQQGAPPSLREFSKRYLR